MLEFSNLYVKRGSWEGNFTGMFKANRFYTLCGESGSGKSTVASLLTGLLPANAGQITLDGRGIMGVPPHLRGIALMTQANSLLPAISCSANLRLADRGGEIDFTRREAEIAEILNLRTDLLSRYPHELSGGQLTRMNLARCLISGHKWIVLDEPFAAVDRPNRLSILAKIRHWQKANGATIVLIAHDLEDIFPFTTDIAVCEAGKITEQAELTTALTSPKRLATARLLKSGLIFERQGHLYFLPSTAIHAPGSMPSGQSEYRETMRLNHYLDYNHGNILRVFDFESQSDFSLPSDQAFTGSISFRTSDTRKLDDVPL